MAPIRMAPAALVSVLLAGALLAGAARAELTVVDIKPLGKKSAQVSVIYRNTTGTIYSSVVITCASPKIKRRELKTVHYFSNHLSGGIAPGFAGSATLKVPLKGAKPNTITCVEQGIPFNF